MKYLFIDCEKMRTGNTAETYFFTAQWIEKIIIFTYEKFYVTFDKINQIYYLQFEFFQMSKRVFKQTIGYWAFAKPHPIKWFGETTIKTIYSDNLIANSIFDSSAEYEKILRHWKQWKHRYTIYYLNTIILICKYIMPVAMLA